ncbi:hypothetical protein BV22DRAFT_1037372 [Leucogyrophana mollusca]|uniref:Uncharacterized protein n=1 Tax=Leucogyrophana mollusca TaxID=85980 RepID=A0ACB8BB91_9AGAM|nr:hypothetical protein BV22DRAFT_1037372 [Leucogyrophana mollusca]
MYYGDFAVTGVMLVLLWLNRVPTFMTWVFHASNDASMGPTEFSESTSIRMDTCSRT